MEKRKLEKILHRHKGWLKDKKWGTLVPRRILDLIRMNKHHEFLVYYEDYEEYEEYEEVFDEMELKYENFLRRVQKDMIIAIQHLREDRKTYAMWAIQQIMPAILFQFRDGKIQKVEDGLEGLSSEKLLRYL